MVVKTSIAMHECESLNMKARNSYLHMFTHLNQLCRRLCVRSFAVVKDWWLYLVAGDSIGIKG